MSLRSLLTPPISAWLLSERRLLLNRARSERRRKHAARPHEVLVFLQLDDPYSTLLAQALPRLAQRYAVQWQLHWVPPPDAAAAPEPALLAAYAVRDAALLAQRWGLSFAPDKVPSAADLNAALQKLWSMNDHSQRLVEIAEIMRGVWQADSTTESAPPQALPLAAHEALRAAHELRQRLGAYQGAMLYYGGEWYWGLDRLHYLEARLQGLGAARAGVATVLFPPAPDLAHDQPLDGQPTIDFFFSLRSPYSAIATPRVVALAQHTGAVLRWRYLLPMVMRGLPVPKAKRRYIAWDAAREARRLGVPFGRVNDPVGRPVERGLALMPLAQRAGREAQYVQAFMNGVWAQGVDAGSDRGLRRIVDAAGLSWAAAQDALNDPGWRSVAQDNRSALLALGLWGVPSFSLGEHAVWGQDRLFVVQDALLAQAL